MATRQPRSAAVDVGGAVGVPALALFFSVLVALEGVANYTQDNAQHCGGGLGRIGPGLGLYATLTLALLVTLGALVLTLVLATASRRWAWAVGLLAATAAAGVLITVGADSPLSRTLVGSVLGVGCAWSYSDVARCCAPLLVAVPSLVCLVTGRRQEG